MAPKSELAVVLVCENGSTSAWLAEDGAVVRAGEPKSGLVVVLDCENGSTSTWLAKDGAVAWVLW